jgi:hypothetical protein
MSKKISSASDTEFREAISKAIPRPHTTAMVAGVVAGYVMGKKIGRRRKAN